MAASILCQKLALSHIPPELAVGDNLFDSEHYDAILDEHLDQVECGSSPARQRRSADPRQVNRYAASQYDRPAVTEGDVHHKDFLSRSLEPQAVDGATCVSGTSTTGSISVVDEDEYDDHPVARMQYSCAQCWDKYGALTWKVFAWLMLLGYTIYFICAISYDVSMATALIVVTALVVLLIIYVFIRDHFGESIYNNCLHPIEKTWDKYFHIIKWFLYPALVIAIILYLVLDVIVKPRQLQSLSGIIIFIAWSFLTSKHPGKVIWRPVVWGYGMQFVFAVLVLRWDPGYAFVKWAADTITTFINYAYDGAAVVFGDPWMIFHSFTMMGGPLIIYVGMLMAVCYYYGLTQLCAEKMGWFFQVTMGTTAIESLSVSANIFLNGMDTMLMLRAYLTMLTKSEFHCLVTGGHATVAGFAFALFVLFGAPAQHVLSAAVMSAPACIAICKLNHPETEESQTKDMDSVILPRGEDTNVFEAGANGAAIAGKTALTVIIDYIAFLAVLSWVDAALSYFGARVGHPELSFELLCSWVFWPLALIMGVEWDYCLEVGKLVGLKVVCSELLAMQKLGDSISEGLLDERSAAIATYALSGFSSLSTLAIGVGVWNTICPAKLSEMTGQMGRIIINANLACFMTACIAGLMFEPGDEPESSPLGEIVSNILGLVPGYRDLMDLI